MKADNDHGAAQPLESEEEPRKESLNGRIGSSVQHLIDAGLPRAPLGFLSRGHRAVVRSRAYSNRAFKGSTRAHTGRQLTGNVRAPAAEEDARCAGKGCPFSLPVDLR